MINISRRILISGILLCFVLFVHAQIPSYYSSIEFNQPGEALKVQLSDLITTTHFNFLPYTSTAIDTWDVIKNADLDTENPSVVLLVYGSDDTDGVFLTDRSRDRDLDCTTSGCIGLWTREHVYPRSLANPSLDVSAPGAGTDVHNLRACDSQMNSSRGNRVFAAGNGGSGITAQGHFYPGDEWKGDVARMMMYMYVRYSDQCLANDVAFSSNSTHPDMPDIFLEWNAEDPVSDYEIQRNTEIAAIQGNRNPFIDNPYLATLVWGGDAAEDTWQLLSVDDSSNASPINIYPTMAVDYIYVNNNKSVIYQYTITDYSGRILMNTAHQQSKIDVSALRYGYYILNINTGQGRQSFKFFKQ